MHEALEADGRHARRHLMAFLARQGRLAEAVAAVPTVSAQREAWDRR
ncbi:hypothetical protein [Kitasatospora sp. NPDC054795]